MHLKICVEVLEFGLWCVEIEIVVEQFLEDFRKILDMLA